VVSRNKDAYGGRFAVDPSGSSVLSGYQQATGKLDKDLIKRNLKPYAKYGMEQSIGDLQGMTDQDIRDMATTAVLAKRKGTYGKTKPDKPKKPKKPATGGGGRKPTKPKAAPKPKPKPKPKPYRAPIKPFRPKPKPVVKPPPPKKRTNVPPKPVVRKPVQPPLGRGPIRV
jgi:hypothetical protein